MKNWIEKLHGFLTLNEREVLEGPGHSGKEAAEEHALHEYAKYREKNKIGPDHESDFDKAVKGLGRKKP